MKGREVIVLLFLVVLLGIILNCEKSEQRTVVGQESVKDIPSQEGWNSKLYLSSAGRLQAIVKYGHMWTYKERNTFYFDEGVQVDFYNGEGDHTSLLTCEAGEYDEMTEDVLGTGNVVVVSDSGMTLHTERLSWDQGRNRILSDTLVMLTTQNQDTLYGVGFESQPDLSHWVIQKPWGLGKRRVPVEKVGEHFSSDAGNKTVSPDSVLSDSTQHGSTSTGGDTARVMEDGIDPIEEPKTEDA